ncbi:hypothetical protein [Stutzerimonas stutzeri]|uniref:hypothetical protein n=1 Tax=Stutzerimonas TaxID=2901164 RepID=UPI001BB00C07|nr:hypothetical protein [Stutzerimonas stutzeri]QUE78360.1 hypothetical protein KCX70_01180 [Stutzerimonas stutzeri]
MKADWNDAPEYITRHPRKSRTLAKLIPGLIGTVITLAVLQMAGSAFLQGTAQRIAEKRIQPKPAPAAEISQAEPESLKDWDKIVDEVATQGANPQLQSSSRQARTVDLQPSKQTIFSDSNYVPRGADNVVTYKEPSKLVELTEPVAKREITIVGQKSSMKDRACWPHKEGSLARRNCRSNIGLNFRD